LVSSAAFGTSGALAKGLLAAGWSPAAAVTWRVAIGALALLVPGILAMRGRWRVLRREWVRVVAFGLVAVAGCQLAYFLAVERLPVAIALLLEYCGVVLVVLWLWLRRGQRPRPLTILGTAVAVAGVVLVLDVFGLVQVDPIGVLWALLAATGLAGYYLIAADGTGGLPPLALASGGLIVAGLVLLVAGALGIVPFRWEPVDVQMAGLTLPWWVQVAVLGLYAAAFAYAAGIVASRRLGSKIASFVGLSEVLFAVLWAWLLIGEIPGVIQLLGGAAILAGVVLIKLDEDRERATRPVPVTAQPDPSSPPAV
ncbi:MAG TPA: DMT family transporter, partial [Trueperaceae bacterium]|nr:DMT family transporter [Trueperaceae bacterium]